MNPWLFVTVPVGLFFLCLTIAFVVSFLKTIRHEDRERTQTAPTTIGVEFMEVTAAEVWKLHEAGHERFFVERSVVKKLNP